MKQEGNPTKSIRYEINETGYEDSKREEKDSTVYFGTPSVELFLL